MTRSQIYITDCCGDSNAEFRIVGRVAALTDQVPAICELPRIDAGLVAGITLADTLMAATVVLGRHQRGITMVVNAAPRDGEHPNGVPFGYFWLKADPTCRLCIPHLVVTTVDDDILIPVRHRLGVTEISVVDVEKTMRAAASSNWTTGITPDDIRMVADTQFRSLWFETLLAQWLDEGHELSSTAHVIPPFDTAIPFVVRFVDRFGNVKLEEMPSELGWQRGSKFRVKKDRVFGEGRLVEYSERLVYVDRGAPGLICGSSGTLELVIGMGDAGTELGLQVGDVLVITQVG